MAGNTQTSVTAPVPDTAKSGPSPTSPTAGIPSPKTTPADAAPKRGPGRPPKPRPEQAGSTPAPEAKAEAKATPAKRNSPAGPEPTYFKTESALDEALAEFQKGEPKEDDRKVKQEKDEPVASSATDKEHDPIQEELDEEEKAAKAANLPVKKPIEPETSEEEAAPQTEPPDSDAKSEDYQKWFKSLSVPAQVKINRLEKHLSEERAKKAEQFVFQATDDAPLAYVNNPAQLEGEREYWTKIRDITEADDASDGVEVTDATGKKVFLETPEQVKQWRDYSRHILNNVIPTVADRVKTRSDMKPWESAEKIMPGLFEKDSLAFKLANEVLHKRLSSLPDYEVKIAHMARSMQMDEDQRPTKDFPKGRAKWVRLELDGEGNVVLPKKAQKAAANTKSVSEQAPKTSPSQSKPAVKAATGKDSLDEALARAEKSRSSEDLDDAYRAFERAAA